MGAQLVVLVMVEAIEMTYILCIQSFGLFSASKMRVE